MNFKFKIVLLVIVTLLLKKTNAQIYVSDAGNFNNPPWQILKFDLDGKNGKVFIKDNLGWPQDIVFREDKKDVLVSNINSNSISRYDIETGAFLGQFVKILGGPTRMDYGPDGLLYVLNWQGNGLVARVDATGKIVDNFTNTPVPNAIGLAWDSEKNLYVSSYNGGYIEKFDVKGMNMGRVISGLAGPTNIYIDKNDVIHVLDYNEGSLRRYDKTGKSLGVLINNIPQCEGISITRDGNILIGVGGKSSVLEYTTSGTLVSTIVAANTLNLLNPNAVIIRKKTLAYNEVEQLSGGHTFITQINEKQYSVSSQIKGQDVSTMDVYTVDGKMVDHAVVSSNLVYDASNLQSNLYIFVANTTKGKSFSQKVMVSK
jgi:sugar lactone lactonase YvrE